MGGAANRALTDARAIGFWVVGSPAPQGSKAYKGNRPNGSAILVESSKAVKPWRQDVVAAALEVRPAEPLDGPLFAHMVFTLPRPKSATRARVAPDRTPDLSKLLRSTEDALTTAGVWADDARVVEYLRAAKVWWGYDDRGALPVCGALIVVGSNIGAVELTARSTHAAALTALRPLSEVPDQKGPTDV